MRAQTDFGAARVRVTTALGPVASFVSVTAETLFGRRALRLRTCRSTQTQYTGNRGFIVLFIRPYTPIVFIRKRNFPRPGALGGRS